MKPLSKRLAEKLDYRAAEGTLRSVSYTKGLVDFYSNDYLSLAKLRVDTSEELFSGTGSRLISGTSTSALDCEQSVAGFFGYAAALFFNSGYDANLGLFSSIPQKGDTVLYDRDIHASIRDGIRLSHASSFSFKHNDIEDLERLLDKQHGGDIYVAVESLYSMKGDIAPLEQLAKLTDRFGAYLIVDEAHGAGVLGKNGKGMVHEFALQDQVLAQVTTFGKAFGAHGAAVLGNNFLRTYLINFARSFIYTTALPPHSYLRVNEILSRTDLESRRIKLLGNISLLRSLLPKSFACSHECSPIQIIHFRDREKLDSVARKMQQNGFGVKAIFSPTVPESEECLRINLHTDNTEEEIRRLADQLNSALLKD